MMRSNLYYRKVFVAPALVILIVTAAGAQPQINYAPGAGPVSLPREEVHRYERSIPERYLTPRNRDVAESLLAYVGAPADMLLPSDRAERDDEVVIRSEIDPSASLEMNPALTHLFINKGMNGYDEEKDTPGLPDSNDIAIELLHTHLTMVGLDLDPDEIGGIEVGGMNMAVRHDDGSVEDYRKFVTVRVSRKLDGLAVLGASRVVARLAEDGNLHSLVYNWTPFARARDAAPVETRSDESINTEIENLLLTKGATAREITVTVSELVLYDDGTGAIEPVYFVVGDAKYVSVGRDDQPEELTVPLDFFVPILSKSAVRLPDRDDFLPSEDL